MGRKVHPIGFRIGGIRDWQARWYAEKHYAEFLHEDLKLRQAIQSGYSQANISQVQIDRQANAVSVTIYTSRPGVVIGRGGQRVDKMRLQLESLIGKKIQLNIQEIQQPELDAYLVARTIADQIVGRISYRRAMKQAISRTTLAGAKGIRVTCSGRLGGAEIARRQTMHEGRVPLHTIRADIDYGLTEAHTTLGRIGVKVWIYRGDILPEREIIEVEEAPPELAVPETAEAPPEAKPRKKPAAAEIAEAPPEAKPEEKPAAAEIAEAPPEAKPRKKPAAAEIAEAPPEAKPEEKPAAAEIAEAPPEAKPEEKPATAEIAEAPPEAKPEEKPAAAKIAEAPPEAKPRKKPAVAEIAEAPPEAKPRKKPAAAKIAEAPPEAKPRKKPAAAKIAEAPPEAKPQEKPASRRRVKTAPATKAKSKAQPAADKAIEVEPSTLTEKEEKDATTKAGEIPQDA